MEIIPIFMKMRRNERVLYSERERYVNEWVILNILFDKDILKFYFKFGLFKKRFLGFDFSASSKLQACK